ncbi:ABC transporter ATP-binding protein [Candidatus Woesearchaeota archaeon]|nr:ABC transporter ATP-binding protein [Candidatus Woesearchaeota archaeon]
MAGTCIIKLDKVWKSYAMGDIEVHALQGLNFEVKKGEFVALMGPSGSGKSTAVNMIGCLDIPSKGDIYLNSVNIADLEESELAQIRGRKIGFIFQQFNLIPTLTAEENVMLPMLFQGKEEETRQKTARSLLATVGLHERLHHKPNQLSGGQQQRVAIARALANDPELILADEPTGNLDSKTGTEIIALLQKLHKQGKTIVIVTHDQHVAKAAQRIASLKDGALEIPMKRRGVVL